jgi:hypothetical protein
VLLLLRAVTPLKLLPPQLFPSGLAAQLLLLLLQAAD